MILLDFHLPDCVMTLASRDIHERRSREIGELVVRHLNTVLGGGHEPPHAVIADGVVDLVHARTEAYTIEITFRAR